MRTSELTSFVNCGTYKCPVCNDALIHQTKRKNNESSSGFGQYIFDTYPKTFYFMDVDGVIYKKATRIMRVIEHKPKEQHGLKDSQKELLPMLARFIKLHVDIGFLADQSGVFLLRELEDGYGGRCEISKFSDIGFGRAVPFHGAQRRPFETGFPIPNEQWDAFFCEPVSSG